MSREIKFRGKKTRDNEWAYGFYQEYPDGYCHIQNSCNDWFPVCADTVGQYVGVKDTNRKEIYEKDIVLLDGEDEYFIVEWDNDAAKFVIASDTLTIDFDNCWGYQIEVVGNVYENTDLLKGDLEQMSEEKYTIEQIVDAIAQADNGTIEAIQHKDWKMLEDILKNYLH